eukprot:5988778-Prymnesium_polylepis.1
MVTFGEFSKEIRQHHDSEDLDTLLGDLGEQKISLPTFCKRASQSCGAQVLIDTAAGLCIARHERKGDAEAAAAPDGWSALLQRHRLRFPATYFVLNSTEYQRIH